MRRKVGGGSDRKRVLRGNLLPLANRGMAAKVTELGNAGRPPSAADNFVGVHGGVMSAEQTFAVKQNVGSDDAPVRESSQVDSMGNRPRKSSLSRSRGAFGERLRTLRLARGITQIELAVETGISRSHIAAMETGADPPGRENLHALATFFDVTMDYLQSGIANAPQEGAFVQDAEELALLGLWRQIPPSERPRIARMLRAAALDRSD